MSEIDKVFSDGLAAGYAGNAERKTVERASVTFETSHAEVNGAIYHDEWAADSLGVGMELASLPGGEKYGRVYGGGVIPAEQLEKLGITKEDVTGYLIEKLTKLKDEARTTEFLTEDDGDWTYVYESETPEPDIDLNLGFERIYYKTKVVFLHVFVKSSIE